MSDVKKFPNYIDGEWVSSDRTFDNLNPADTDDCVGVFSKANQADVNVAASAAHAAYPAWAAMNAPARGKFLYKVADILESNLASLARDMTREEGKTLPEATGETMRSINIFRYFAGEGSRMPGHLVPSERDRVFMYAVRRPLGVVAQINPWNFPKRHPGLETGPGSNCRQHRLSKTGDRLSLKRLAYCGSMPRSRNPQGRSEFHLWFGWRSWRRHGVCRAHQGCVVHRLVRGRPRATCSSIGPPSPYPA